jgi:cell division septation protein DedD
MSDEALHEIQLSGKQLVFVFMASTVAVVVVFLCGVMVGRGVQTPRTGQTASTVAEASVDPTSSVVPPPPPTVSTSQSAPIASQETLTYPNRLEDPNPPVETLKEPVETLEESTAARETTDALPKPAAEPPPDIVNSVASSPLVKPDAPPAKAAVEPAKPAAPPLTPAVTNAPLNEPAGNGFVVQVAAVKERSEADTIARRLNGKGYPTFITMSNGAVRMFRVRVGKYPDRREAESIAGRLEKEEQFKPWITR